MESEPELNLKGWGHLTNATIHEYSFRYVSLALGKTEEEVVETINEAHKDLDDGYLPWQIKLGPFNRTQVRSKVEYFQEQIAKHKRVFSKDKRWNRLEFNIFWLYKLGYIKKTDDMLDKTRRPEWKGIKQSIQERINKIIEEWGILWGHRN